MNLALTLVVSRVDDLSLFPLVVAEELTTPPLAAAELPAAELPVLTHWGQEDLSKEGLSGLEKLNAIFFFRSSIACAESSRSRNVPNF